VSVAGKTRELDVALVTDAVRAMCIEANYDLPDDVCAALERGAEAEESPAGKAVFAQLAENAAIARRDLCPRFISEADIVRAKGRRGDSRVPGLSGACAKVEFKVNRRCRLRSSLNRDRGRRSSEYQSRETEQNKTK